MGRRNRAHRMSRLERERDEQLLDWIAEQDEHGRFDYADEVRIGRAERINMAKGLRSEPMNQAKVLKEAHEPHKRVSPRKRKPKHRPVTSWASSGKNSGASARRRVAGLTTGRYAYDQATGRVERVAGYRGQRKRQLRRAFELARILARGGTLAQRARARAEAKAQRQAEPTHAAEKERRRRSNFPLAQVGTPEQQRARMERVARGEANPFHRYQAPREPWAPPPGKPLDWGLSRKQRAVLERIPPYES